MVNLAPRLDPRRNYDWPSGEELCQKLIVIAQSIPNAYLHCEHDTDQEPLIKMSDKNKAATAVRDAVSYCLRAEVACPTFCYGNTESQQQ